ncbi:MAG: acyl-CoA dehydrogenase family protein, partial [Chloroflexota bacterium]
MVLALSEEQKQIVTTIRDWVKKEVIPVASEMEHKNEYPAHLIEQMKEMGLFGVVIPTQYGGLGLDYTTYAMIFEEICKGWMGLSGPVGTHSIMSYVVMHYGTEEQKKRFLPKFASGEKRGGLALTEPNAGSDVQAMQTTAVRDGDWYVVNGTKTFITNARHGNTFALLAKTNTKANPPYKGISCFIAENGDPGFKVGRDLEKLGYKSVDTCEIHLDNYRVPVTNLVGMKEGEGFVQVMAGLEVGRINVAARAVGVAAAAFEAAIRYAQQRQTFGKPIAQHQIIQTKLADMATELEAARL